MNQRSGQFYYKPSNAPWIEQGQQKQKNMGKHRSDKTRVSRSTENLPEIETSSIHSYSHSLANKANSHLQISDVWTVLEKLRHSYKNSTKHQDKLVRIDKCSNSMSEK